MKQSHTIGLIACLHLNALVASLSLLALFLPSLLPSCSLLDFLNNVMSRVCIKLILRNPFEGEVASSAIRATHNDLLLGCFAGCGARRIILLNHLIDHGLHRPLLPVNLLRECRALLSCSFLIRL